MRFLLLLLLVVLPKGGSAQPLDANLLDTTDQTVRAILTTWRGYLAAGPGNAAGARYWQAAEVSRYPEYDFVARHNCMLGIFYNPRILTIRKRDTGLYEIVSLLATDSSKAFMATARTMARRQVDGSYRLGNYLLWVTRDWPVLKTAHLTYHYPPGRLPDTAGARRSEAFLRRLESEFAIPLHALDYYVFNDCEDSYRLAGMDAYNTGLERPVCGCFQDANNMIYSGGRGFYYPHELAHLLNRNFPNGNVLLEIGFAGLLGGSRGKPLSWHQPRVLAYMEAHPKRNFNAIADFNEVDEYTNPQYVVYALFCLEALRQGGVAKLKRMLNYGREDAAFYWAVERELGIRQSEIGAFVKNRLRDPALFAGYTDY